MHMARPTAPRLQPVEEAVEQAREAMRDQPINAVNVTATMAHNPELWAAFGVFAQQVLYGEALSRRQVELAVLRMGWNCQAVYEFGQHTLFGRDAGLTDDEIYLVTRPIGAGAWDAADRAILQVVDDLYTDDCIADATWASAAEHFAPASIVHLVMAAGCYRTVSGMLNSCGVVLDDGVPGWPTAPA
jgi:alkylhydroperoxidase family enzyme